MDATAATLVHKVTLPHVAGMPVHLHFLAANTTTAPAAGLAALAAEGRPLAVAFLLHGRLGDCEALDSTAAALVQRCAGVDDTRQRRNLVVVTLDHRNHGHRRVRDLAKFVLPAHTCTPPSSHTHSLVCVLCSESWRAGNETHAQDMFSIQYGTAQDVSLLISLLPAYLPAALRVELWACVGVSLGGHSAWLALLHDPRITVGVPIIGCCDYLCLMRNRVQGMLAKPTSDPDDVAEAREEEERYLPEALKRVLRQLDAGGMGEPAVERLKGRKLLVLCGADDRLVPYHCSQPFIERLQQAMAATSDLGGLCEVVVEEGKGHELTDTMVIKTGDWLLHWACARDGQDARL